MADPLATLDDLADWLGEVIEHEDAVRARSALAAASVLVRAHTGRSEFTTETAADTVRVVVLSCAARAYTNPEGWSHERVDDWGAGGRPVQEAGLFLTATERRMLDAISDTPRSGLSIISTDKPIAPGPEDADGVYRALTHDW